MVLETLLPGSICHAPKVRPDPVLRAFWSLLAACMVQVLLCWLEYWQDGSQYNFI